MSVRKKSLLLIIIILLVDQVSKIYIKLNFRLGDFIHIFDWFQIISSKTTEWLSELKSLTSCF